MSLGHIFDAHRQSIRNSAIRDFVRCYDGLGVSFSYRVVFTKFFGKALRTKSRTRLSRSIPRIRTIRGIAFSIKCSLVE